MRVELTRRAFAPSARAIAALFVAVSLCACSDEPWPAAPLTQSAIELVALTPTALAGTVAASAIEPPAVMARDASGNPVPGVPVVFTIVSGGGEIVHGGKPAHGFVTSNGAGIATMPGWRFGTIAGENKVLASSTSLPPVSFTVVTVHSPHHATRKTFGDDEVGEPGRAIRIPPALLVVDTYGNPISGVPVTFTISGGGGTLAGSSPTTGSDGIAAVGSWTLGPVGRQEITGTYPGLATPIVFSATAVEPMARTCGDTSAVLPGGPVGAELGSGSCSTESGRPFNVHSIDVETDGLFRFLLSSPVLDPWLEILDPVGIPVARHDIRKSGPGRSELTAYLNKGEYTLRAGSISPVATGGYNVSWSPGSVAVCDMPVITRHFVVHNTIWACGMDQFGFLPNFYRVHVRAGRLITATLKFNDGFMEPTLKIANVAGTVFTEVTNFNYDTSEITVSYVAQSEGYYVIVVAGLPVGFWYSLMVQ
ncbi:MAG: hypothetical protein ACSLFK_00555 [Gemmatimonadaceae bacterium]